MIHEVGNIELCELLDTEPKTQCKVCLSYWDIGIVYCTCGHFLRNGTEENMKFVQYTMDLLSIPDYYIKKGRPHGHRYGKKPGDHEYFIANSLKKKLQEEELLGYSRPVGQGDGVPKAGPEQAAADLRVCDHPFRVWNEDLSGERTSRRIGRVSTFKTNR